MHPSVFQKEQLHRTEEPPESRGMLHDISIQLTLSSQRIPKGIEEKELHYYFKKLTASLIAWKIKLPPALERDYFDTQLLQNFLLLRIILILGICFLFIAQLLEGFLLPEMPTEIWQIRTPVVITLLATWLIANTHLFRHKHQSILSLCLLLTCLSILAGAILFPIEPYKTLNYMVVVLVQLVGYSATPIRPINAVKVSAIVAALTLFSLAKLEMLPLKHWVPIASIYLLGTFVAVLLAFQLERINLINFIQATRLNMEKVKLNHANAELKDLATTDALTGIANRREFDQVLQFEWNRATRNGQALSLLFLDLDFFKQYNDTYGHQMGDICLVQIAQALSQATQRSGDTAFRFGGEEFVIIVPSCSEAELLKYGEIIRQTIEDLAIPHQASTIKPHITCSIGGASWQVRITDTQENFIKTADQALYRAKANGKNCVSL
ncbi:MAG: hypothetical protein COB04_07550 [Gammaproteobacteria bacterium]|nr:MAG: hypothetical protein COB04_07550 [Gammaproteobacteria bacterium]